MTSKPGSKKKAGPSARPTRAASQSRCEKAASGSPSTVTTGSTAGLQIEPGSLFSTPLKLSDGDPKSLTVHELNLITIQVAEFMMDQGFPSFRYNETLNGLRSALAEQLEFIGVELPPEQELYVHTQWWKLRDYTVAQSATVRAEEK